jgi:4-amino-4-deoxy-L-arabinose transferase-like glycosyltransferase
MQYSPQALLKKPWSIPLALFLLTAAFMLAWLAWHGWGEGLITPYTRSDAAYYLHYAWMIAFVDPQGGELQHIIPPSPYVCLLIGAYKLLGPGLAVPYLVHAALYIATVLFIHAFTKNLFDRRTGAIAGVITCLCGPLLFYAGLTMKVIAVAAFTAAALYSLERYISRRRLHLLALTAVFTTLLALERNNAMIFIPALALLIGLPRAGLKTAAARAAVLAGAVSVTAILVSGPFADAHPTSPLGTNIYMGNSKIASGAYASVPGGRNNLVSDHTDLYQHASEQAGRPLSALETDLWWIQQTIDDIRDAPLGFLKLTARKTLMMFSAYSPGAPNRYRLWRWEDPFLAAAVFDYGLILALALPGVVLILRQRERRRWIIIHLALTSAYALTVIAFYVLERYRIPVMIALIPPAAWTIASLTRKATPALLTSVVALYALTHLLTLANPVGSGWGPVNEDARKKLAGMRADYLEVYRDKVKAIETNDPQAWDRLAFHYYEQGMAGDGKLFLEKYNRLTSDQDGTR